MDKGLQKVGSIYYFQKRVPCKLSQLIGIKIYKRSLETDSLSTARNIVNALDAVFDGIFKEYKRPVNAYENYTKEDMLKLLQVEFYKVVDKGTERVNAVLEGKYLSANRTGKKISTLVNLYLNYIESVKKLKAQTVNIITGTMKNLSQKIGDKYITDLSVTDVQELINDYSKTLANSSVKLYLTRLKTFLNWVEVSEDITISKHIYKYISDYRSGLKVEDVRDAFTVEQVKKIFSKDYIKVFRSAYDYFPILLGYTCGLRIGEAVSLQMKDLTFYGDRILLKISEGKTENAKRFVVVPRIVMQLGFGDYIQFRIKQNPNEECSIWGNVIRTTTLSTKFSKYLIKLGIKTSTTDRTFTEHSLRHTFSTKCISSGVDDRYAKKYIGHSGSSLMTQRYMIQSPEVEDLIKQIDSKLDFYDELNGMQPYNNPEIIQNKLEKIKQLIATENLDVDETDAKEYEYYADQFKARHIDDLLQYDLSSMNKLELIAYLRVMKNRRKLSKKV